MQLGSDHNWSEMPLVSHIHSSLSATPSSASVPATDAAGVRGRRRREGDQVDWGFRGMREVDMETEFVSEREEEQHGAGAPAVRITPPPTHMLPLCVSARTLLVL